MIVGLVVRRLRRRVGDRLKGREVGEEGTLGML